MADERTAGAECLHRIAATLGVPMENFFQDDAPHQMWAERECMRLWYRLKTNAGRGAALDALRKALDDEGA